MRTTGLVVPVAFLLAAFGSWLARAEDPAPPASPGEVAEQVDALIEAAWTEQGLEPAGPASDAEILRRLSLDLTGRLPTPAEAKAFLDDAAPDKRARLIDRLLASEAAGRHLGEWYARALLGRDRVQVEHRRALEDWLAGQYAKARPFNEVVAELLSASGPVVENGAAAYVAQFAGDVPALAGRSARLFLGVRVQCAQCHDHPWDEWKQSDFHGFAAYFARAVRQKIPTPVDEANGLHARAKRHTQTATAALARVEKEVEAATAAAAARAQALAAAEKRLKPFAPRLAKAEKPVTAAKARVTQANVLAAKAKTLLREAAARATRAAPAAGREIPEQEKTARSLSDLAAKHAATAQASLVAWTKRLQKVQAEAKPLATARDKARAAVAAAEKTRRDKQALRTILEEGLAGAKALETATRELAGIAPAVYNDSFAAKGERIPPPAFRVTDRGGKLAPKKDPKHPERGDGLPRPLRGESLKAGMNGARLRGELAAWVRAHQNPFLAKAVVNRLAERLLGKGFVDPVDDLTGPGERFAEPALERLAEDFGASGYDVKRLLSVLARTRLYQLTSARSEASESAAHARVRELSAPVAFRAFVAAVLPGLPDAAAGGPRAQREAWLKRYGDLFDDASDAPATAPQGGVRRSLWLMNGAPAAELLRGRKEGLAARLAAKDVANRAAVEEVFLALLSRRPTPDEAKVALNALPAKPEKKDAKVLTAHRKAQTEALEDLVWALVNGTEFLTNH